FWFLFSLTRLTPISSLFPYTTLFRSHLVNYQLMYLLLQHLLVFPLECFRTSLPLFPRIHRSTPVSGLLPFSMLCQGRNGALLLIDRQSPYPHPEGLPIFP